MLAGFEKESAVCPDSLEARYIHLVVQNQPYVNTYVCNCAPSFRKIQPDGYTTEDRTTQH
jgi:hypothetical protein